jgi:hypothetical protein
MARPSKFKPEFIEQARKLAQLGATDREIADFFEVCEATLNRWKGDFPELCASLKIGKAESDDRVERSLYHRALGYKHDAVKIFQVNGVPLEVPYVEHFPPDTTAAIFWLKNRRPEQWRDKVQQELTGADGGPVQIDRVERVIVRGNATD